MNDSHPNEHIALKKGDPALAFSLPNTDNDLYNLDQELKAQPLVLVFYRGDW